MHKIFSMVLFAAGVVASFALATETPPTAKIWTAPDVSALPYDAHGQLVRRGRDLFVATYAHIGPGAPDPALRYAGNNLACGNCHLDAGLKKFGLPVYGVAADFPAYSARSGEDITLPDRINACMTRSMNGGPLPLRAPQMRALVAYVDFLSTGVRKDEKLAGLGAGAMPELTRAADPDRGHAVYQRYCEGCHNVDGAGVRKEALGKAVAYAFPPLWGPDSFNDGAGMARLITAANFVHSNMPNGVDYLSPRLSAEAAWDVAAWIVSRPRPHKANAEADFPDPFLKPVDAPYGPYVDGFSEQQHRFGPWAPIREKLKQLAKEKATREDVERKPGKQ